MRVAGAVVGRRAVGDCVELGRDGAKRLELGGIAMLSSTSVMS